MSDSARQALADNLKKRLAERGWSESELSRRSGVSQKAVNNAVQQRASTQLDTADAMAKALGINCWQLLAPSNAGTSYAEPEVLRLIANFTRASDAGRNWIEQVAEREAHYNATGTNKPTD